MKNKYEMKNVVLITLFLFILIACKPNLIKYKTGHFPDSPINLQEINSEFDDYNSDLNIIFCKPLLSFSSNRETDRGTFDIISKTISFSWDQESGIFNFEHDTSITWYSDLELMIDSSNSTYNELGPYTYGYRYPENCYTQVYLYSSDIQGNYNIYYSYAKSCTNYEETQYSFANKISFIDTSSNELYPSFYGENIFFHNDEWEPVSEKISNMIYCSDKNGQFDIYEANFDPNSDLINLLSINEVQNVELLDINSLQDDKCPFVNGKLMVFASNRAGGFGGYDLYYSQKIDAEWSIPTNFGSNINTEFDEYRPITILQHGFDNNLMIFSSDRDGGKGGFDLYYVGIHQMIE
ncbi:MAG: hypothetical protein K8R54_13410 [Bacteroidales bacterium]|nr:hypothetical protein [Bacteroidales bacterium]